MEREKPMIAACGLDCGGCDMREAAKNPQMQREFSEWFQRKLGMRVKPEDIHCMGCKGDRSKHWSPDCEILLCCVDSKGLEYCFQCEAFPCDRLTEWAKGSERYGKALDRLHAMKKAAKKATKREEGTS